MLLNRGGKSSERECEICHSVENLVSYHDQKVCDICRGLYQFSKEIAHDHFIITENEGLPIGPNACLKGVAFEKLSQEAFPVSMSKMTIRLVQLRQRMFLLEITSVMKYTIMLPYLKTKMG